MRVGIISPIRYLSKFPCKLNLCFASLLGSKAYLEFYGETKELLILEDTHKLPRRPNLDRLEAAVKVLDPEYVLLPSWDFSTDKTVKLATAFLRRVKVKRPIGVLQGYDIDTLQECYSRLKDSCEAFALPCPLETIAKRAEISRDLKLGPKVLWIEVYKNPYDEVPPRESVGICTSFPLRLAQVNKRLSEYTERPSNPATLDYYSSNMVVELAKENVDLYIQAVQG